MSRSSSASEEPTPSASPSLTASAEATAAPSASAEPSEPQQAALGQGWGRIDIAVNLRDGPGPSSAIVTTLREGDVIWVNSQPEQNGGRDWYYVMTLNNTRGWIASGPANAPYATTISNRYVYNACGQVSLVGNYGVVDGLRTIRLERLEQGTFELAAAMGVRGCVRYRFEDYEPHSRFALEVHACGVPAIEGTAVRLGPTSAGDVDDSWRVPGITTIPELLLTAGARQDEAGLTNRHKILILASGPSSGFGCVTAEVIRRQTSHPYDDKNYYLSSEVRGCLVMVAKDSETVSFASPGDAPVALFRQHGDDLTDVVLSQSSLMTLNDRRGRYFLGGLRAQVGADC